MKRKSDYILDFRSAISSIALLDLKQIYREMKKNQEIEIWISNEEIKNDIFKLLSKASYELVDMINNNGTFCFHIRKTGET